jgi:hypothetical protein
VRPRRLSVPDAGDEASERETLPAPAPLKATSEEPLFESGDRSSSTPELVISETTATSDLIEAIAAELDGGTSMAPEAIAGLDVLELVTFLARGSGIEQLASDVARRQFVQQRLLHRLPVSDMDQVDHVDLAPWTASGTMIVRVWCKITAPRP